MFGHNLGNWFKNHLNSNITLFRRTLITASSREIIVGYGYVLVDRDFKLTILGIFRHSRPPC